MARMSPTETIDERAAAVFRQIKAFEPVSKKRLMAQVALMVDISRLADHLGLSPTMVGGPDKGYAVILHDVAADHHRYPIADLAWNDDPRGTNSIRIRTATDRTETVQLRWIPENDCFESFMKLDLSHPSLHESCLFVVFEALARLLYRP